MLSLLRNPKILANVIGFILSMLVTAGYIKAGAVSPDDIAQLAGGIVSLLTILNAFGHVHSELQRRNVQVQSGDPPAPEAGSGAQPVDMGGA
jgi:hypothetical protein